jgi:hypothetical protein
LAISETGGGRGLRPAFVLARVCIDGGNRLAAFFPLQQPGGAISPLTTWLLCVADDGDDDGVAPPLGCQQARLDLA